MLGPEGEVTLELYDFSGLMMSFGLRSDRSNFLVLLFGSGEAFFIRDLRSDAWMESVLLALFPSNKFWMLKLLES